MSRSSFAFATIFVWGGLIGVYTVMLPIVGSRYGGGALVGIYAVMGLPWGVGALVGPPLAGLAMSANAHVGLPLLVALAFAFFASCMLTRRSPRNRKRKRAL